MAPYLTVSTGMVADEGLKKLVAPQAGPREYQVTWHRVLLLTYQHIASIYGLHLLTTRAAWPTIVFNMVTFYLSSLGVCAGAHRLWSHRSYKATRPLQMFLMLCHSIASQHSIFIWVKDHRLHHRYSDTDGDPYNASRGFVYSHIGWTCVNRHPEVQKRGKLVDLSDIFANPIVMFQKQHKEWLNMVMGFILPTFIPMYFWNETFSIAFHANQFRYILCLNGTFSINSLAHMFGTQPYDKNIAPSQNIITTLTTCGEGFHNYHHTFPFDYKAGEVGSFLNFSTSFIYFCAKLGLAYDLREVSKDVLEQRMTRTGDRSKDTYGVQFMRKQEMKEESAD
uniref:Delta 11-desaturase like protein n=1 Tax=Ascotis selenaria cretacea TaxID=414917 RepID=A9ZSZ6_9NEOP|nr:delta 11-desaturase like protein [Ascotis selenaria cretacea]